MHYRNKHIPLLHVSLCKLVQGISLCQLTNTLVHTKYILHGSACQNVSIMTRFIHVQRSVTPRVTKFDCVNLYIFPVRTSVIVFPSVCPSPVWLLSYLSTPVWFFYYLLYRYIFVIIGDNALDDKKEIFIRFPELSSKLKFPKNWLRCSIWLEPMMVCGGAGPMWMMLCVFYFTFFITILS